MTTLTNIMEDIDKRLLTKDHDYNCTAWSEGCLCCLDKKHPNREKIEEIIAKHLSAPKTNSDSLDQ